MTLLLWQEWRHAHGMRCLGVPNTAHFANVTLIEDAIARQCCIFLIFFSCLFPTTCISVLWHCWLGEGVWPVKNLTQAIPNLWESFRHQAYQGSDIQKMGCPNSSSRSSSSTSSRSSSSSSICLYVRLIIKVWNNNNHLSNTVTLQCFVTLGWATGRSSSL